MNVQLLGSIFWRGPGKRYLFSGIRNKTGVICVNVTTSTLQFENKGGKKIGFAATSIADKLFGHI
jgi:uncharacterized protein (DUF2141 family)